MDVSQASVQEFLREFRAGLIPGGIRGERLCVESGLRSCEKWLRRKASGVRDAGRGALGEDLLEHMRAALRLARSLDGIEDADPTARHGKRVEAALKLKAALDKLLWHVSKADEVLAGAPKAAAPAEAPPAGREAPAKAGTPLRVVAIVRRGLAWSCQPPCLSLWRGGGSSRGHCAFSPVWDSTKTRTS